MTVSDTGSRISYAGNGSTTVFSFPYYFLQNSDLVVEVVTVSTGATAVKTLGTDYSVSGAGLEAGGTVTMTGAPASGQNLIIYRDPPATQTTSYNNNDPFPASAHETALDKLTMLIQRLINRASRYLTLGEGSSYSNITVPDPEAGKYLRWKADLSGLENSADTTTAPNNYGVASQSEAEAGILNTVLMTPLRVLQTIAANIFNLAPNFATRANAIAATISASVSYIRLSGYSTAADGGGGLYARLGSTPSPILAGHFQSADGAWWELADNIIWLPQIGAFGAAIGTTFSSVPNELTAIQAACDFAAARSRPVGVPSRFFGISGTLLPGADVVLNAFNSGGAIVNLTTSSGVRYDHRTKLLGNLKLYGTGTTNVVERLLYPAVASCVDSEFDVTLGNATFGLQAEYIDGNASHLPSGQRGTVREDKTWPIVGVQGNSEGYLCLLTALDTDFTVYAYHTARHAYYLSAGACRNKGIVHADGCMNYAVQINAYSGQSECSGNHVWVFAKNLQRGVTGSSGALAIVGNCSRNKVEISQSGALTDYAVLIQGADDGTTTPRGNEIICRDVSGAFVGTYVVRLENEQGTRVHGAIVAKATTAVIGIGSAGTNGSSHGAIIDDISIDTFGADIPCVNITLNDRPCYVGTGFYKNSAGSPTVAPIKDQSSGYRKGYAVEYSGLFSATGAAATSTTSYNVTMPGKIDPTYRQPAVSVSPGFPSVTSAVAVAAIGGTISKTNAVLPIGVYNGHSAAQTIPIFWRVAGDPALP